MAYTEKRHCVRILTVYALGYKFGLVIIFSLEIRAVLACFHKVVSVLSHLTALVVFPIYLAERISTKHTGIVSTPRYLLVVTR